MGKAPRIFRLFKEYYEQLKLFSQDTLSSLFELRVKEQKYCPYFSDGMDNLAVLLKGRSIEQLPQYAYAFEHCFLVNNFDGVCVKNCLGQINALLTGILTEGIAYDCISDEAQINKDGAKHFVTALLLSQSNTELILGDCSFIQQ